VGGVQTVKEALTARLAVVRAALATRGSESRTRVAERVCHRLDLHDARGQPRVGSCLQALRELERAGEITLPPHQLEIHTAWKPRRLECAVPHPRDVPEQVREVRDLCLELVEPSQDEGMRTWTELLLREHPQGARLVGSQLRYLVRSAHGVLGAVGVGACALSLSARECWIGWDAAQRTEHRSHVLQLSRLLVRPSVRCRHLASWVLGACVRRIAADFEARYGLSPWLLETFVDESEHAGTCFVAAGWRRIGQTRGRGRSDREGAYPTSRKGIYVYPLVADFRERMGVPPQRGAYLRPRPLVQGLDSRAWIEQEFGTVELGDQRLRERLMQIVSDRAQNPSASYLTASGGDRHATKRFYAFIDTTREEVTPEAILATHRERTIERMMTQRRVLVVQDSSDLRFSTRPLTVGLGPIGTNQTGALTKGLRLHSAYALSEEGLPLGVLRSVAEAPPPIAKLRPSASRPIEQKKSFRWLEVYRDCVAIAKDLPETTRQIVVMDREGDIFELLLEAMATRHRVGIVVRARGDRRLVASDPLLFDALQTCPTRTTVEIHIPRQRAKDGKQGRPLQESAPARSVRLTIAYTRVTLDTRRSDLRARARTEGPVELFALEAREQNPPKGAAPIRWRLLTTEPIQGPDDAAAIVSLYSKRWRIEEWHRVLKSGCDVQGHQHETAQRLQRVIAIDVVLAWRIQLMTLLGRALPELPAETLFDDEEIEALEALHEDRTRKKLTRPLKLKDAVVGMARLGGYLARKSDPPPGAEVLWTGLVFLGGVIRGFRLARRRGS
jgi:hypothetical protein